MPVEPECDAMQVDVVAVSNLGAHSVDFTVRVWCARTDYWPLKFDMLQKIKETFDARGVEIPFPTTTIVRRDAVK